MSYLLLATVGDLAVVNTITETSIYSDTIPANALSTDKLLEIRLIADWLNNTGSSRTYIVRVKFGGTTFFTFTSLSELSNAGRRSIQQTIWVGASAANAQRFGIHNGQGDVGSDAGTFVLTTNRDNIASNEGTIDTTVNQTLQLTVENSIASASLEFRRRAVLVSMIEAEVAAATGISRSISHLGWW